MESKKCLKCGHTWFIRKPLGANKCPRCQSKKLKAVGVNG